MVIAKGGGSGWVGGVRERDVYFKSDTYTCAMCIVFYRVSKSDLWSYMVNTDLLPATPSSWVLSCVVFLLGGNQQIEQIVLILSYWGKATKASKRVNILKK